MRHTGILTTEKGLQMKILMAENETQSIAPDVQLGNNVYLGKFINLYGCSDRGQQQNRGFC